VADDERRIAVKNPERFTAVATSGCSCRREDAASGMGPKGELASHTDVSGSAGPWPMLGITDGADSIAHIIQIALTPVFLLSGIASLLSVFSTRLARVADRVDSLTEKFETASRSERTRLEQRLTYLRRRSHLLDAAVMLGTLGGAATCLAALLLFVGTLRDQTGVSLFIAFGLALLFTMGALAAFLFEMLLASRGIRDHISNADETAADVEPPESKTTV